jgi:hypothetical protein
MRKEEFISLVSEVIKENPSWFGDMIQATQYGILDKLKEEQQKRCDAETVCMVLYEKVYNDDNGLVDQIKEKSKAVIREAIMYKGTNYAKNL